MGRVSSSANEDTFQAFGPPDSFSWSQESGALEPRERRPFSVTGALGLAQKALQDIIVTLVGEVSEVSAKAGYKAVYFTVKDEKSSLSCMMWNNRYQNAGVQIKVGMKVELTGRFTLYAARGTMNFDVFSIKLTGEGELRLQIARMMAKLAAEGLTAPDRKRALPEYPQRIGLVTSPRGATVHDVLRTLRNRYPYGRVLFAGVPVEGASAPAAMIAGIDCVCQAGAEVVLLIRGGGSIENLMPFNDEALARAIAACPVPVVTGIGHETDTTVADLVADLRALTPTAAATAVSPDSIALMEQLSHTGRRMHNGLSRRLERSRLILERYAEKPVLKDVTTLLSPAALELDGLQSRLFQALPNRMQQDRTHMALLQARLSSLLAHALDAPSGQCQEAATRLRSVACSMLDSHRRSLATAAAQLDALSPVAVLARGYAVVRNDQGDLVSSVEHVRKKDQLRIQVSDGTLSAQVTAVNAFTDESSGKE